MFLVLESLPTSWTGKSGGCLEGDSRRGRESLAPSIEHSCPAGGLSRGQSQAGGFAGQQGEHSRSLSLDLQLGS